MDHQFFCPAYRTPLAELMNQPPGVCECGADGGVVATAVKESLVVAKPVETVAPMAATPQGQVAEAPAVEGAPKKKPRKPRAKKGETPPAPENGNGSAAPEAKASDLKVLVGGDASVAPGAAATEGQVAQIETASVEVIVSTEPAAGPVTACADSRDDSSVPEATTITVPPEASTVAVDGTTVAGNLCLVCWGPRDLVGEDVCMSCARDMEQTERKRAARAKTAKAESKKGPVVEPKAEQSHKTKPAEPTGPVESPSVAVVGEESKQEPPVAVRLYVLQKGKRRKAVEKSLSIPRDNPAWMDAIKKDVVAKHGVGLYEGEFFGANGKASSDMKWCFEITAEDMQAGAAGYAGYLDGINLRALGAGEVASVAGKPKLTDGDKAVLLDFVSKNVCVGCRQGLLLEGEGMEPVVSSGLPGQTAWVSLSDPTAKNLPGEKWHLACLRQKEQLEKEGRIKIDPKDGTYEILPSVAQTGSTSMGPPIQTIPRKEAIDSTGAPMKAPEKTAGQVEISEGLPTSSPGSFTVKTQTSENPEVSSDSRRYFVGIDPDIHGYLVVIDDRGEIVHLDPMPTTGGEKPVYDEHGMVRLAVRWKALGVEKVLVEQQQALGKFSRGGKEVNIGSIANFKKGLSYGLWRGILAALGISFDTIRPVTWKKDIQIAGGDPKQVKARAVTKAQSLYPKIDMRDWERSPKSRVPDPAKAEAILLSRYVMLRETGGREAAAQSFVQVDPKLTVAPDKAAAEGIAKGRAEVEAKFAELDAKLAAEKIELDKPLPESACKIVSEIAEARVERDKLTIAASSESQVAWLDKMSKTMTNNEKASDKTMAKGPRTSVAPDRKTAGKNVKAIVAGKGKSPKPVASKKPVKSESEAEKAMRRVLKSLPRRHDPWS